MSNNNIIVDALMAPMEKSKLSPADCAEVARIATATAKLEIKLAKIDDENEASRWAPIDAENRKERRTWVRQSSDAELQKEFDKYYDSPIENATEEFQRFIIINEKRRRDKMKNSWLRIKTEMAILAVVVAIVSIWLSQ